jgi:hypothetical protein
MLFDNDAGLLPRDLKELPRARWLKTLSAKQGELAAFLDGRAARR